MNMANDHDHLTPVHSGITIPCSSCRSLDLADCTVPAVIRFNLE